ncbi:hypothetical protein HJD18_13340 [Thermoleophilia bacterium SCSIO 60948]|nr:hypothetical protein HJD18_13340 [Thermoleophilia bacterium SCSIO 60948]
MAEETGKDGLPVVSFGSRTDYVEFLEREGTSSDGVWAKIAKKGSGETTATYAEMVEASLRYGWIDSQVNRYDESFYLQRFTPRRPRSKWSRINRDSVERLIAAGEMHPMGLAEVERAKADGRWEAAYEPPSTIEVPGDLQRALDSDPRAAEFFAGLSKTNRYSVLWRVHEAKRPETRARRIAKYVEMCARGETPHP